MPEPYINTPSSLHVFFSLDILWISGPETQKLLAVQHRLDPRKSAGKTDPKIVQYGVTGVKAPFFSLREPLGCVPCTGDVEKGKDVDVLLH
jgi:hypothetical protein